MLKIDPLALGPGYSCFPASAVAPSAFLTSGTVVAESGRLLGRGGEWACRGQGQAAPRWASLAGTLLILS